MSPLRNSRIRAHLPLALSALFAICWITVRANIQSMTIDEGDSYVYFVSGAFHNPWYAHPNNHVLNSALMKLTTSLFGLTEFTVRMPAVFGGILYISSCYLLCIMITRRALLRWPLFMCLVFNPFLMDYFVAGRGYGLALGCLLAAVTIACRQFLAPQPDDRSLYRRCALFSLFVALSFCANFAFAICDMLTFGLFVACLFWPPTARLVAPLAALSGPPLWRRRALILACCLAPGALAVLFLCARTLLVFPRSQLVAGANSLRDTWETMIAAIFYEFHPHLLGRYITRLLNGWKKAMPFIGIGLFLAQVAITGMLRQRWRMHTAARRLAIFGSYVAAIVLLAILFHWTAFHTAGLLLPKDRTSTFFVPLSVLALGVATSLSFQSVPKKVLEALSILLLFIGVVYFIGCLRLSYFNLWKYDADVKDGYQHLVSIVGPGHDAEVISYFGYISALNFYRVYFHDNSFKWFFQYDNPLTAKDTGRPAYPPGRSVYVIEYPQDANWVRDEHLKIVYRGTLSDMAIAVKQ